MDRVFLAVIVSGLLLAAASMSLLVLTSGSETTVSVLKLPPVPTLPGEKVEPRPADNRPAPQTGRR